MDQSTQDPPSSACCVRPAARPVFRRAHPGIGMDVHREPVCRLLVLHRATGRRCFGLQVALYVGLRRLLHQSKNVLTVMAASGTTSTAAMISVLLALPCQYRAGARSNWTGHFRDPIPGRILLGWACAQRRWHCLHQKQGPASLSGPRPMRAHLTSLLPGAPVLIFAADTALGVSMRSCRRVDQEAR